MADVLQGAVALKNSDGTPVMASRSPVTNG